MSQTNLEGLELLGNGDPVVVSQQLFEKTNPERIESLLQELQLKYYWGGDGQIGEYEYATKHE